MTAQTTDHVLAALEDIKLSLKGALDVVQETVPPKIGRNLHEAMRNGGANPVVADEYGSSLTHWLSTLRDDLNSLMKEVGAAQHIVATGVHKTPEAPNGTFRKYLVL